MLKWTQINEIYPRGEYATLGNNDSKIFELHWVPKFGRWVITNFLPSSTQSGGRMKAHFADIEDAKMVAQDMLDGWLARCGLEYKDEQ